MVKWEYLEVYIAQGLDKTIAVGGWHLDYLPYEKITVRGVLDDIGAQSWELVGFQGTTYVFKRPVSKD